MRALESNGLKGSGFGPRYGVTEAPKQSRLLAAKTSAETLRCGSGRCDGSKFGTWGSRFRVSGSLTGLRTLMAREVGG